MKETIREYVNECNDCQRNKSRRHKRFGLLQPLEVVYAPWVSISMNFIIELPESKRNTQVWVVVDRFTKIIHFIPLATRVTAAELAQTFLWEIWKLHGLSQSIISDRNSKFTFKFWAALMSLLDVQQKLSTAFHSKTDDQTKRVNQSLK
jgi:hypothetical protein